MTPEFDHANHEPLTVKVREHILGQIRRGAWKIGGHLPSVRDLAGRLDVSTNVVFVVIKELREEGLLEKQPNGRHIISDNALLVTGNQQSLHLGFCSCGTDHIRHDVYQSIYNHLDRACDVRSDSLECLLECHDTWSNLEDNHYDALIVADWKPENYQRICRGLCIGLDTWEGLEVDAVVKTNHHHGGELAARHLRQQGRRRVTYWDVIPAKSHLMQGMGLRRLGFMKGWLETGGDLDEIIHLPVLSDHENLPELVARQAKNCDAFFVYGDADALRIWSCMQGLGITVPGDLALMGFDGSYDALKHDPPLTTVRQPCREIAEMVMQLIGRAAANPQKKVLGARPQEYLIEPVLVVGKST